MMKYGNILRKKLSLVVGSNIKPKVNILQIEVACGQIEPYFLEQEL
jgi:hypothetical protein